VKGHFPNHRQRHHGCQRKEGRAPAGETLVQTLRHGGNDKHHEAGNEGKQQETSDEPAKLGIKGEKRSTVSRYLVVCEM
jgi:hypothetical protein